MLDRYRKVVSIIILDILLCCSIALAERDIRNLRAIELKGLNYVSKQEIFEKVDIETKGEEIVVDVETLREALSRIPLVKSYKMFENDGRLDITVVENRPQFLLAVRKGVRNITIEVSENFQLLSINRIHAYNMPLVIISDDQIENKRLSVSLQNFLTLLLELRRSNLAIYRNISEIDLTDLTRAKIFLNGRKTVFIIKPDKSSFYKLNYATGYFDKTGHYPDSFELIDTHAIIKR